MLMSKKVVKWYVENTVSAFNDENAINEVCEYLYYREDEYERVLNLIGEGNEGSYNVVNGKIKEIV